MRQSQIIQLLDKYHTKPLESLSQNFFIDQPLLTKVLTKIDIHPGAEIIEIGSGLGALTKLLVNYPNQVTTIEIDKTFARILPEILDYPRNLRILHQDILDSQDFFDQITSQYVVIANIPYHLTGAIIRFLITQSRPADLINLLIQQEVADKLLSSEQSLFKLSVEIYAQPKLLASVPKESFYPRPKVDSSFIQIIPHSDYIGYAREKVISLAKTAFQQKRKKLSSSLQSYLSGPISDYSQPIQNLLDLRPQALTIPDWLALASSFNLRVK